MENQKENKKNQPQPSSKSEKSGKRFGGGPWMSLAGAGAQMGVTIFIAAWAGKKLDAAYPSDKNWWTIGLTLAGVAISLYNLVRQVNRLNDRNK